MKTEYDIAPSAGHGGDPNGSTYISQKSPKSGHLVAGSLGAAGRSNGVVGATGAAPESATSSKEVGANAGTQWAMARAKAKLRKMKKRLRRKKKKRDVLEKNSGHLMKQFHRFGCHAKSIWLACVFSVLGGLGIYNVSNIAFNMSGVWEQAVGIASSMVVCGLAFEIWISRRSKRFRERMVNAAGVVLTVSLISAAVTFSLEFASMGKGTDVYDLLVPKDLTWLSMSMIFAEISGVAILHNSLCEAFKRLSESRYTAEYILLLEEIKALEVEIEELDQIIRSYVEQIACFEEREERLVALYSEA